MTTKTMEKEVTTEELLENLAALRDSLVRIENWARILDVQVTEKPDEG